MKPLTNSAVQFLDLFFVVAGSAICVVAIFCGGYAAWQRDWSMASLLVLSSIALWFFRVRPALHRFREAVRADREFEKVHRGSLDWKGDPIEPTRKKKLNQPLEPTRGSGP